jgi:hypothetical protein
MTDQPVTPAHLWPCGCLVNDGGAHRGKCPVYERAWFEGGGWIWTGRRTAIGDASTKTEGI